MPDLLQLFVVGVVSSYGPCLISCWPIALPFITAINEGWRRRLQSALVFLLAKLVVYGALGFAAATLGRVLTNWLSHYAQALVMVTGLAIMLLGLRASFTGSHPCGTLLARIKPGRSLLQPALLGLFVGFIPCATSMAVAAFIALRADNPFTGAVFGLAFGAGKFFSPLLPAAVLVSLFEDRLKVNRVWVRWICGILVSIMGLRLLLDM